MYIHTHKIHPTSNTKRDRKFKFKFKQNKLNFIQSRVSFPQPNISSHRLSSLPRPPCLERTWSTHDNSASSQFTGPIRAKQSPGSSSVKMFTQSVQFCLAWPKPFWRTENTIYVKINAEDQKDIKIGKGDKLCYFLF